jgi:selenocysteine lyase/cysteine desulfurase
MKIFGLTDAASFDRRVPTVSFLIDGHHPYEVATRLGQAGIFSWAGDHFAIEPMRRLGVQDTQRVGLVHYNTPEEIERFVETLSAVVA